MVVVSYSGKEINAKLVYYGCGLCGKTTNLESIYEAVPDTSRGKMVSMKTQSDRTLFFDLLPLDLGEIMGFKTRFLLYTVPGQVFYNATRKLVLKGADAIVFVADSEVGKMEENKESLENLRTNLAEYKIDLDEMPWLIQYNKRDLPNVYSIEEMQAALNPGGKVPHFEAVATQGKGVFETFRGISHMLMEKVTRELRRGGAGTPSPIKPAAPIEAPAPRAPAAPATLPSMAGGAPGRAIAREAMESRPPEPILSSDETPDYGREIELPDEIPPPAREPAMASAPPAPHHAPAPESAPPASRPAPEPARRATAAQPVAPPEPSVDRLAHVPAAKAGHKRVALARRTDREFIDARVSRAPSPYALEAQVDEEAVLRTARESEFRRHSGLAETLPDVRFALTEIDGYGELYAAIRIHAFDMSEEQNRIVPWAEVATDWYRSDYRPTVEDARGSIGQLIDSMTDADIFLTIHRRRQAWWGSECDAIECAAQELLVEQQMAAARKGTLRRLVLGSPGERASRAPILPLADEAR